MKLRIGDKAVITGESKFIFCALSVGTEVLVTKGKDRSGDFLILGEDLDGDNIHQFINEDYLEKVV